MKRRLFSKLLDLFGQKEGEVLRWWGKALRWIFFPINTFSFVVLDRGFVPGSRYDGWSDVLYVNGHGYTVHFLRGGLREGVYRLTRAETGEYRFERLEEL